MVTADVDLAAAVWKLSKLVVTLMSHLVATVSGAREQRCSEEEDLKKTVRAQKENSITCAGFLLKIHERGLQRRSAAAAAADLRSRRVTCPAQV